ncbi:hypothetical protein [Arenicella xantha]|uniref:Uncharacterized protein n=1 Tax=Arenicella xantha TaxID=644221 RepID=A0A395JFS3_9GAMM|nr:hypothetical protein [Arenicella xantha]RBP48528.1 hypothetical protein DFR28_10613 [Arenicella xantha]
MPQPHRRLIVLLAAMPLIPEGIALLHLLLNGGLDWPMRWNNEVVAWTLMLSSFALASLFLAMRFKQYVLAVLPVTSLMFVLLLFVDDSAEPSSKSDAAELELVGFWFQQWSDW